MVPEPSEAARPRLRPVEAFPVDAEGKRAVAIRDPAGWTDAVLVLSPETVFVLSCFDGSNTLRDVQEACYRRFQEIIPLDQIGAVAEALDKALLLDSENFRSHRAAIEEAYLKTGLRPAGHAGGAYDAEPDALRARLDALLEGASPTEVPQGRLAGLIAPHIDLHRGGAGYGAAYRALRERCDASTFVIFGTAHEAPPGMYIATRKAYDTPIGAVPTDVDLAEALAVAYGDRFFEGEIVHRNEHSIEFQAVLLRHVFADREIRIVPILCSSFHESVERDRLPTEDPRVAEFLAAARPVLEARSGTCLVAAADLAHLGPRFGDEAPVSRATAAACGEADRLSLDAAARADATAFFGIFAREKDRRRVCGISAIYTLLELLPPGTEGTLLHYGQALDPEATTFVSFASMAFTRATRPD